MSRLAVVLCAALILTAVVASDAQVPETLSYQGVLRDAAGVPVPTDDYLLTFRLYDVETGGTELWSEPQTLTVTEGIVNATLGVVTPFGTLEFDSPYWLGISVAGESELIPRAPLASVPYAFRALHADVAADEDWSISGSDIYRLTGRVGIGTETPETELHVVGDVKVDGRLAVAEITSGLPMAKTPAGDDEASTAASSSARRQSGRVGFQEAEQAELKDRDNDLNLQTDGTTRVHIDGSTGNVGVGTETPGARLDVAGSVQAEGLAVTTDPSDMFVLTSDASGNATWQPSSGERVPSIVYADRMAGSAGERILAAITVLTSGNSGVGQDGIVDARGIPGGEIDVNLLENINCAVTLLLGTGEYKVLTPQVLDPPSNTVKRQVKLYVRGQGSGSIIVPVQSMTIFMVEGEEAHFSDLMFDMESTSSTAIYLKGVTWFGGAIERVRILDGTGTAPYIRLGEDWYGLRAEGAVIRDVWMGGNAPTFNAIEVHSEEVVIDHTVVYNCLAGVYVDGTTALTITNCQFEPCQHALLIENPVTGGGNTIQFIGNTCEDVYGGAIRIIQPSSQFPVRNLIIRDNYFTQMNTSEHDAIVVQGVTGLTVEANRFASGFVGSGAESIVFIDAVEGVSISGNIVRGIDPFMPGYDTVAGLPFDDVTATQSSGLGGFGGGLSVMGQATVSEVLSLTPTLAPPPSPEEGDMYMDSSTHKLMVYDGAAWKACW